MKIGALRAKTKALLEFNHLVVPDTPIRFVFTSEGSFERFYAVGASPMWIALRMDRSTCQVFHSDIEKAPPHFPTFQECLEHDVWGEEKKVVVFEINTFDYLMDTYLFVPERVFLATHPTAMDLLYSIM